jgi:hypothetical protein
MYSIKLLFADACEKPTAVQVKEKLESVFGKVDILADSKNISTFLIHKYNMLNEANKKMPAQVLLGDFSPFSLNSIDELTRSQFRDIPNPEELLRKCNYQLQISDFLIAPLFYKERCEMLVKWLDTVLDFFPSCIAVYYEKSGKLLSSQQVKNNLYPEEIKFLYGGMNIRYFNIQGTEDSVVDTLGLYAIGLPDIQYCFRGLPVDAVVDHAFNVAAYIFAHNANVNNGDILDGFNEKCVCQHATSILEPSREVIDINPGKYAAGNRG